MIIITFFSMHKLVVFQLEKAAIGSMEGTEHGFASRRLENWRFRLRALGALGALGAW